MTTHYDVYFKKYSVLLLAFLMLLPSCAPTPSSINPDKRYSIVREKTKKHTGVDIDWERIEKEANDIPQDVKGMIDRGISRADAVSIALQHNPELLTQLEELGISRADLAQAGFYSNPSLDTIFLFPKNDCLREPAISFGLTVSISDLWRVPLREKVAQSDLEITTSNVLQTIIDTIAQAKTAYDNHLLQDKLYDTQKAIVENAKSMRESIFKNLLYPKTNTTDRNLAETLVFNAQLDLINLETDRNNAYIELRNILGLWPEPKSLKLTSSLALQNYDLPTEEQVNKVALANSPQVQIAKLKIQQATDSLKYEKASFIQDFSGGVQYLRDIDNTTYFGPEVSINIPLFDNNSAQIAHAQAELKKAHRDYKQTVNDVVNTAQQALQNADAYDENIDLAKKIVTATEKAILYADQHPKLLELNVVNALEIRQRMYNAQKSLLQIQYDAIAARHELERILGKSLDLIPIKKESGKGKKDNDDDDEDDDDDNDDKDDDDDKESSDDDEDDDDDKKNKKKKSNDDDDED